MEREFGKQYIVVPYRTLKEAAQLMEEIGEEQNSFVRMLDASDQYIAADLTPVVLYDMENHTMICIVKELYGKKLH